MPSWINGEILFCNANALAAIVAVGTAVLTVILVAIAWLCRFLRHAPHTHSLLP